MITSGFVQPGCATLWWQLTDVDSADCPRICGVWGVYVSGVLLLRLNVLPYAQTIHTT